MSFSKTKTQSHRIRRFISARGMADLVAEHQPFLMKCINRGVVRPDAYCGDRALFYANRWHRIAAVVESAADMASPKCFEGLAAASAVEALPHFEAEARARMMRGDPTAKLQKGSNGEAREKAAEVFNVSPVGKRRLEAPSPRFARRGQRATPQQRRAALILPCTSALVMP
jgi:hypothetical protein